MKHLKMVGLLVMATASLMAFSAGSASAEVKLAVLTSPAGTEFTGEIHATIKPGTTLLLKAGIEDTCTSGTVKGTVTTNNTTHATGAISVLKFGEPATECTKPTTVLKTGTLTVGDKGEVIANENQVTVFDLGVSCVYGGLNTNIGTLTGGSPAVMDINTTKLPKISGGFLCASEGTWTGTYTVTSPNPLLIT